jgi:hypothetical protein
MYWILYSGVFQFLPYRRINISFSIEVMALDVSKRTCKIFHQRGKHLNNFFRLPTSAAITSPSFCALRDRDVPAAPAPMDKYAGCGV